MRDTARLVAAILTLALAAGVAPASVEGTRAAAPQAEHTTVWDGVFTADQAARGKAVYESHCSRCHGPDLSGSQEARSLAGARFMQDWREDTVDTLFTRIRSLMPFDDPATLSDAAYLDSVAYILEVNGFPGGSRELAADGLADIRIEDLAGPGQVPSFALVQVVGCLTRHPDDGWMLTRSTEPVRTADPSASTAGALTALGAQPLGAQTFTLMSAYPDPAPHTGHKMEAKGFLIRGPEDDRINLSSLAMVAAECEP